MIPETSSSPTPFHRAWNTVCSQTSETISAYKPRLCSCFERVQKVANPILYTFIGTFFFLANTNLFILGAVVTIINPKFTQNCTQRIIEVFKKISPLSWIPISLGAVFAWPIMLGMTSFFFGAHACLQLIPNEQS